MFQKGNTIGFETRFQIGHGFLGGRPPKGSHNSPKTEFKKGYIPWNTDKKLPKEMKEKISRAKKGCKKSPKAYSFPLGENHPNWIRDRTKVKKYWLERNNPEYKQWIKKVKKRDANTCRLKDKNCSGYNIAHHILGWIAYPELRYEVSNGITLCQHHHPRKRDDEIRLIPIFLKLINSYKRYQKKR